MDLITYGLLNKAKANLDSPAFTGTPTAPTPLTPDNSNKLATTEFVRSVIATLKGFYLGVTTTTLVDEVTTDPDVVINGETVTAQDGNWVIAEGGEEFVYSGTVWQKFGDSNWISVIGNTYNPALTYNTGDCVIYMDGLYECKEDNVTGDWDSAKWQTTTVIDLITGGIPLENLSNVTITNPQAGNHLVFDGTEWKNSTVVSPALSELSDVNLENTTDGQALIYNDTTDKWENQDISTGEVTKEVIGNPVEFDDGSDSPLMKCVSEIQGSQDLHGYDKSWVGGAGKNKWPSFSAFSENGITCVVNDDGSITLNGTATANVTRLSPLSLPAGAYSLSLNNNKVVGTSSATSVYAYIVDNDNTWVCNPIATTINSKASGTSANGIKSVVITVSNGAVLDNVTFKLQLESGSTPTTYAPYSNICPITAYTEGEIEVRGRNLANWTLTPYYDATPTELKMGTYTISIDVPLGDNNWYIGARKSDTTYCTKDELGLSNFSDSSTTGVYYGARASSYFTFTIPEDDVTVKIGSTGGNGQNVMLELGSTATVYEPYTSTTHTTTFPSAIYRGSEDVVNGTETHDKLKIIFDGSNDENWIAEDSSVGRNFYINIPDALPTQYKNTGLISNMFEASPIGAMSVNKILISLSKNLNVPVGELLGINTVADWKTWLSTHNLEVIYNIIPTTSSVTPTNLPIKSLSGYTHIESSTGDMEVEYITENYQPLIDLIESAVELPEVSALDDGKVLTVVNGKWVAASLPVGQNTQY